MKYGIAEFKVPAVVELRTEKVAGAPTPTSFGEPMVILHMATGKFQLPHRTSRPGSNHMRLSSGNPQSHKCIASVRQGVSPNSSLITTLKHVNPVSMYDSCSLSSL